MNNSREKSLNIKYSFHFYTFPKSAIFKIKKNFYGATNWFVEVITGAYELGQKISSLNSISKSCLNSNSGYDIGRKFDHFVLIRTFVPTRILFTSLDRNSIILS